MVNLANTAAGDLFCLTGSASQVVRVQRVSISGQTNNATTVDMSLVLRSSLNTGGTPTTVPVIPSDGLDPPATASVTAYGTAPVAGTTVGTIRAQNYQMSAANQGGTTIAVVWLPTPRTQELAVLRGATNTLCIATSGLTGGSWDISVHWLESAS